MNKKNKFFSTILATLVGAAIWIPSAQAAFILDTKIGEALLKSSGDAAELDAMKAAAGNNNLVLDLKVNSFIAYENGAGSGEWYLDINPDTPGYFLLKFGTGSDKDIANTYFFQNIGEMTKLVWSNEQVGLLSGGSAGGNIGRLSHYTTFDPTFHQTGEIPEPATLALVGLGLFAIGAIRRRKS
ncbi:PEP-CTERM sorting domain-containing protein [Nitrosospira sp. Nsp1]|uniref:PEP-CTERM sorting domain-containing protein n=1 Tax=Nitrosospira sp. Nsp1 TaxID=136547 RepID=UPI00088D57F2|nr:PEP-CTERM sorting domain-containing protein [Nitrosospira sp. Nsp1]SCX47591.1 PEP-CTERM protein-sorting domain-containing protein [Nitrosospira sp. Nsp1]